MLVPSQPIPPELESQVRAELARDEKVLWLGAPRPWSTMGVYWGMAFMGLLFAGFAVVWMVLPYTYAFGAPQAAPPAPPPGASAARTGPPLLFTLFGVPFVLIGLWMLASPLRIRRSESGTAYALTDRRAIVIEGPCLGRRRTVASYAGGRLASFERIDRADGAGDIVFERVRVASGENGPVTRPRGFLGVQSVREIDAMLREAAAGGP